MKRNTYVFWGLLLGLSALWFAQSEAYPNAINMMAIRNVLIDYSGILSIGAMSVAMILAMRSKWLEPFLNGLDKSYRLHKWLGIAALVASVVHWLVVSAPKWAVSLGWMAMPERKGPPPGAGETEGLEALLSGLRMPAEFMGEKAFYIAAILMVLALVKWFPYKRFFQTHFILAITYLVLVFHTIVLFPFELWLHPVGIVVGLLMVGGTIAAICILLRTHGKAQEASGHIIKLTHTPSLKMLETRVKVKDWKGHKAGQFAFVTFDKKEGKHPFTMASSWDSETNEISFLSKELGDYTALMPHHLHEGDAVTVEGPYGQFTFEDGKGRQIWVGAGIGVTPFMARLQQMAHRPSNQMVDFFHVTSAITPDMEEKLQAEARAANVQLHLIIDRDGSGFSAEKLRQRVVQWKEASLWFCGPANMRKSLKGSMVANGIGEKDFHQELFDFR